MVQLFALFFGIAQMQTQHYWIGKLIVVVRQGSLASNNMKLQRSLLINDVITCNGTTTTSFINATA